MDDPLMPKSLSKVNKLVVAGSIGCVAAFIVTAVILILVEGMNDQGYIVVAVALVAFLATILMLLKWLRAERFTEGEKQLKYLAIVQAITLVVICAGLLAVIYAPESDDTTFTLGGIVSGLESGSVSLQLNGDESTEMKLTGVKGCKPWLWSSPVAKGSAYEIKISKQPDAFSCTLTKGKSTANANVNDIMIDCNPMSKYSIGGSVTGVSGTGLVLQNNGGDNLAVNNAGPFVFSQKINEGADYVVTVYTQPTGGQTCSVTNDHGTARGDVSNVAVACR